MARAASTICSLCEGVGTQRGMDRDGNGGWKHRAGECKAAPAPASFADLEAGHAERLAAAGLSTGLRADAEVKASPPTAKPREDKNAGARGAAHRIAVLDFLRPKSPGMSYSPGEIARGAGVLLEEVDVVIKALLASGEIEEIDEEEDEDPSYRAKPSAPALPKPRVNRRGKPAAEAARTCRVRGCGCTEQKSCDMGAGRTCAWTSGATPAGGDTCSLCADLIERAEEAIKAAHGAVPAALADDIFESCDAPALGPTLEAGNARLGACIEIAAARTKPTKKDRPTKKSATAQASLPGSEVARTLTLPVPREPLAAMPAACIGTCASCGADLTPENSSKLRNGAVVHVGCARAASDSRRFVAPVAPIALSAPCAPCGAASGEPCAFATPEPASYIHDARLAVLPAEERAASRRRAAEDRIRVALDEHAAIPGDPPVPTAEGLVRGLVVPGDFDVFTLRDVLGAMIARGEVHEIRCVTERAGIPATTYLRRAEGGAPVVMGRVGVRVPRKDTPADAPGIIAAVDRESAKEKRAEGCDVCGAPATCHGEHDGEETRGCDEHCGHGAEDGRCEPIADEKPVTPEEAPPEAFDDPLAEHAAEHAAPSVRRPVDPGLHAEEPERVGVEQAESDGGEAGGEGAHAASIAAAPASRKGNRHELSPAENDTAAAPALAAEALTDRPLSPAERLLVALSEVVRGAEEAREAARACLAGEIAQRGAVEQLDAVQRERDEQTAVANALHVELADVRAALRLERARALSAEADRAVLRAGINRVGDVLTRAAGPGKIGEGLDAKALAAELERIAWVSLDKEKASLDAYNRARGALRSISEALGGAAPSDDDELIAEAVSLARRPVSGTALRGALSDVLGALGAERGADLSDEELGARAVQCAGLFGEAAIKAILDLSGEKPTASKPLAEQLLDAARDYGPRAGSFSTELETEVITSIHRLAGVAPIGEGRAALARALRDAVTAALAKKPAPPPPPPPPTPIRRPWHMPAEEKENS